MNVFEQSESLKPTEDPNLSSNVFDEINTNFTTRTEYSNQSDSTMNNVLPSVELFDSQSNNGSMVTSETNTIEKPQASQVELKDAASEFGLKKFDNMDSDGNGFLSNAELESYETTNSLTEEEQKIMGVLKSNNEDWQTRSNDEIFFENNGVSKQDLAIPFVGKEMINLVENHFDDMDSNRDGVLKADEVKFYANQNELNIQEQEAAKFLAAIASKSSPTMLSALNPFGDRGLNKEQAALVGQSVDDMWKNK